MDWKIQERAEVCAATGKAFVEGDVFYTLLMQQDGQLVRQDLSTEAWEQRDASIKPISFWRAAFKPAPLPTPEAVNRNDAESQLRVLLQQNDPAHDKLACILALLLERKKILLPREQTEIEGKAVTLYEHTETQETLIVPRLDFKLADLAALQTELQAAHPDLFPQSLPATV